MQELTRFSTVSTMSRLLTSPTCMSPIRTANFILILRMGTDGLMTPPGSTMEPEPPGASLSGQPAPSSTGLSALAMSPHTAGGAEKRSCGNND